MKSAVRRGVMAVVRGTPPVKLPPQPLAILAALPAPVVLLDRADRFAYANQAAEQFFGLSLTQLAQLRLSELVPPDNPIFLLIGKVRAQGTTIADHELTLESPRLPRRETSVQGTPMAEFPGGVLLVLHDASAARTLGQQASMRNAARSVAGMAATLAHEVKNPLSGIRGAAQLLETSVAPSDRELAVLIRDEADRIRALVDRMEAFGDKPVERRAVNIHRVLEHVRRLAQNGFAAGLRFTELYDPSLPPVWGNRDQLVQVVLNLVKNAAEAVLAEPVGAPEIVLATAYRHGMRLAAPGAAATQVDLPLVVTVRDNGPGIAPDMLRHLFDPFVSSKPAGSGLGLALAAKIVADHGGLIEVDSRPGRTEFHLHLPVAPHGGAEGEGAEGE